MNDTINKTKFTPGPWIVSPAMSEKGTPLYYNIGLHEYETFIASFVHEHIPVSFKQAEANARLIAAAPEMYELLRKGLEDGEPMNWDEVSELLNRINP